MKTLKIQRLWFLTVALFFLLISNISCISNSSLVDVHDFSNLVLDQDTLWFGAGYKLYRVDLNQQIATLVYDTKDVVITFVQIGEKEIYFGGYESPNSRDGSIWSFDIDTESILWRREFKGSWFGWGGVVIPLLIDKDTIITGTRTSLYGIDKFDGGIKWRIGGIWLGTAESLTPILANGQLFYGIDEISGSKSSANQAIVIANPSSGKTLKTISIPGSLGAIPTVHGDWLFVKDYQSYRRDNTGKLISIHELRLNCVDLNSGKIIWSFQGHGISALSQINFYKGLVLDVFANQLYAIDEQSGAIHWQSPRLEAAAKNPQIIQDLNIISLEIPASDKVIFVDAKTGDLRDEALLNVLSSPIFLGNDVIYGTTSAITRVDISTGDTIWSIPVESQYQVFSGD